MTQTMDCPVPSSYKGGRLSWHWAYRDSKGAIPLCVARYDGGPKGKEFVPYHQNGVGLKAGLPAGPTPLFGLDSLRPESTAPVYIVEGERCAAALHSLGLQAVTSVGGSGRAKGADWGPLSGVPRVVILPDNDEPGERYAADVAGLLRALPNPPEVSIARLPGLEPKGDVADWLASRVPGWDGFGPVPLEPGDDIAAELLEAIEDCSKPFTAGAVEAVEAWEAPIPLDACELPAWPRDILPGPVRDFAAALSASTQTPPELADMVCLGVLSVASQGRFQVRVAQDYFEPLSIWPCIAMEPATRKTAVLSEAMGPVVAFEREQREALEPELKAEASRRKTIQGRIDGLRARAAKADFNAMEGILNEIATLESTLPPVRYPLQLWTSDATAEVLAVLMDRHLGCMSIVSDEAGPFGDLAGRYAKVPNLDVYLKGHAGSPVRVNRIGRDDLFIDNPALTILLTPQPGVIRSLSANPELRDRGVVARFLILLPQDGLGHRMAEAPSVPAEVREAYHSTVKAMLRLPWYQTKSGRPCANTLTLSPEAASLRDAAFRAIEPQLGAGGTFEHIRDWAGKLCGAMVRIAGIMHVARHCHGEPWAHSISGHDMACAIELGDALSKHALIAFDAIGADASLDDARYALAWIQRARVERFTQREVHAACKARLRTAEAVEGALSVLVERGFIRLVPGRIGAPGRPSKHYLVNPLTKGA